MFVGRNRGISLVEILVGSTLLLGLVALMTQVIGPVMSASGRTSIRVELQSVASVAMQRIETDLTHTSAVGFSGPFIQTDRSVKFAIHRNTGFSPNGTPLWSTQLVLYRWDPSTEKLSRLDWPPNPDNSEVSPLKVLKLDESQIDDALANGIERVVASNVTDFHLGPQEQTGVRLPLEVRFRLERPSAPNVTEIVEFRRKVLVRN